MSLKQVNFESDGALEEAMSYYQKYLSMSKLPTTAKIKEEETEVYEEETEVMEAPIPSKKEVKSSKSNKFPASPYTSISPTYASVSSRLRGVISSDDNDTSKHNKWKNIINNLEDVPLMMANLQNTIFFENKAEGSRRVIPPEEYKMCKENPIYFEIKHGVIMYLFTKYLQTKDLGYLIAFLYSSNIINNKVQSQLSRATDGETIPKDIKDVTKEMHTIIHHFGMDMPYLLDTLYRIYNQFSKKLKFNIPKETELADKITFGLFNLIKTELPIYTYTYSSKDILQYTCAYMKKLEIQVDPLLDRISKLSVGDFYERYLEIATVFLPYYNIFAIYKIRTNSSLIAKTPIRKFLGYLEQNLDKVSSSPKKYKEIVIDGESFDKKILNQIIEMSIDEILINMKLEKEFDYE